MGKSGIREMQSGTRDVKEFVSISKVLTDAKTGSIDLDMGDWKVERRLPEIDSELRDGNSNSEEPSVARLQSMSNIY